MAVTEFSAALNQVATERGIPVESVLESIRMALASAYRKDYGGNLEEIQVALDPDTGEARILKEGEDVTPAGFGRIAAQTAKQVILQKIRETEKEVVMDEYKDKVGTIVSGHTFRVEGDTVILDLGKAHGIMPPSEQVDAEQYRTNQRLRVLVKEVRDGSKGPEIIVSRADPEFIRQLFIEEVPEIASGVVTIDAIAREPGSRTKIAVSSRDEKIDPVGSCVGRKGVRVQSIIAEVFGEKIDIIPYSSSVEKFVAAALSPARVTEVDLDTEEKRAIVSVPEDQQSLAIGKAGQNARLANKLTKWKIDIKGAVGIFSESASEESKDADGKPVEGTWDAAIRHVEEEARKNEAEIEQKELDEKEDAETKDAGEIEEAAEETAEVQKENIGEDQANNEADENQGNGETEEDQKESAAEEKSEESLDESPSEKIEE